MLRILIVLALLAVTALAGRPERTGVAGPARIGLALSGGAALGIAHIGVFKVFEKEGIEVVAVSGNSMGSMVGGLYAAGMTPAEMESIAVHTDWNRLFSSRVPFGARYLAERRQEERYPFRLRHQNLLPYLPSGIVPLQNVDFLLMQLLAELEYNTGFNFDSLPVPYRAVAVDLLSGKLVTMRDGRLSRVIRASVAIPGVFSPATVDTMKLVDGGVQRYLPVEALLDFEPDIILAVLTMKRGVERGHTLLDIVSRSMDLVGVEDLARQRALADLVIEPDVEPFLHSDFARARELIAAGEQAAEAALPRVRELIAGRGTARYRRAVETRPLPVVRRIEYQGLNVTRTATLQPLVETRPGSYLLFGKLREDLVRIFNTGLYEEVNYRLEFIPVHGRTGSGPPMAGDSVDVIIELQERAYGFYLLGMRYDNAEQVGVGIEVGQGNIWGTGAGIRGAVQLGQPTEFRGGLSGVRLLTLPFSYRLEGYWWTSRRRYYETGRLQVAYSERMFGLEAELGYGLGRNAFFTLGFDRRQAWYSLPDQVPPALEGLSDDLLVGPNVRLEFNNCDDLYLPGSGTALSLEVRSSLAVFSPAREMVRAELRYTRVSPLRERLLFREDWSVGLTLGDSVRVEYFNAGGGSMTGFAHGQFSSPYRLSFEPAFDFRLMNLLNRADSPLYLRVFTGVAAFKRPDLLVSDINLSADLHWTAGAGLVGNTPLGPAKLLIGWTDFGKPVGDEHASPAVRAWLELGRDFRYVR